MNNSLEKIINVLVENRTDDNSKLFGRSEYMTSSFAKRCDDLIEKL